MKTLIFFLHFFILSSFLNAQDAGFQWVGSFGSFDPDYVGNILVDAEGSVFTVGNFQNLVDFDPGPGVFELDGGDAATIFIHKLNSEGGFEWCKTFGNSYSNFSSSLAFDTAGNILAVGSYQGTIDFDPGVAEYNLTAEGGKDFFILKLNESGEFISVYSVGGMSDEFALKVAIDPIDNIYIAGRFSGITDFDPSPDEYELASSGGDDIFIEKLDSEGNFIWVKSIGGSLDESTRGVELDADGNIFICGNFEGTADFDPSPDTFIMISDGFEDGFILKLDEVGDFQWAAKLGGELGDLTHACALDSEGNVYSVGSYTNSTDFDPGLDEVIIPVLGLADAYIQKLSNEGEFIWVKTINTEDSESYYDLFIDETDGIYLTGLFEGTADFDPSVAVQNHTSNDGTLDFFVQHLNNEGELIWVKTMGGEGNDIGEEIALNTDGEIYITGRFRETVDFNPNFGVSELTSNGSSDIFVLKLAECTSDETNDIITACNNYTWIDGITYTENNNSATWLLSNVGGCDSLVTIDLTIVELDNSVSADGGVISSNDMDATYQWLDCNDGYSEIMGETSQEFIPVEDGEYAVRVEQGDCVDTSECLVIEGVGIYDNSMLKEIHIYPNPSGGAVNIDLGDLQAISIQVYSVSGNLVYQMNDLESKIYSFELDVDAGVYFVEVLTGSGQSQFKLVIE